MEVNENTEDTIGIQMLEETINGNKRFLDILRTRSYSALKNTPVPTPLISVCNETAIYPILSKQNIAVIRGYNGTGKSTLCEAILTGLMRNIPTPTEHTLGLTITPNVENKAVLYVDTEQSDHNFSHLIGRALARSELKEIPPFIEAVNLRPFSQSERLECLLWYASFFALKYRGIHTIVLDGVADFVANPNDEAESIVFVDQLIQLATLYDCCIIVVIHTNAGAEHKARGHLGSHLERKAEGVLSVSIEQDHHVIESKKLRNSSSIPKILFSRDNDTGCHRFIQYCYTQTKGQTNDTNKIPPYKLREMIKRIFTDHNIKTGQQTMRANELTQAIAQVTGKSIRTATTYIKRLRGEYKVLRQDGRTEEYSLMIPLSLEQEQHIENGDILNIKT